MNIDLKILAPYLVMIVGFAVSWGMLSERLDAVEAKADKISDMYTDIAVIKEKIMQMDDRTAWIEEFLIKTAPY